MGCCQSRCLPFYRISNRMRKSRLCQNVRFNRNSRCCHYCRDDDCTNNYKTCFHRPIYSGLPSHHSHFPISSHLPINCQQKCFHNHHQCPSSHCPNSTLMSFYYRQQFCPISNFSYCHNNNKRHLNHNHHYSHFVNHSRYNKMQGSCCPSRPM